MILKSGLINQKANELSNGCLIRQNCVKMQGYAVCRVNRQLVLADNVPITRFEVSATAIAGSREEIGTPSYAKQPLEAV